VLTTELAPVEVRGSLATSTEFTRKARIKNPACGEKSKMAHSNQFTN